MQQNSQSILYHVHDPMCSWCWAFVPVWEQIKQQLPDNIEVRYLLGGLAPDSNEPMPSAMRSAISGYWKTIEQRVPGTRFNFDFGISVNLVVQPTPHAGPLLLRENKMRAKNSQ